MAFVRFPIGSPYAVPIGLSRLMSDTARVIDCVHSEHLEAFHRVDVLQSLFVSYELPEETHPLALEQFAVAAGITGVVSVDAVDKMRVMLGVAVPPRDTDPDGMALNRSPLALARTQPWSDVLERLSQLFQAAADRLRGLSPQMERSEKVIIALETLGHLRPRITGRDEKQITGRDEKLLMLCEAGAPVNPEPYQLDADDFESLQLERDRFLNAFFRCIIDGLPRITQPYLTEEDRLTFGCMAIWLASKSDALLHTARHLYSLPLTSHLAPLGLNATMRGLVGDHDSALAARRMLRFAALAKAKDRARELEPASQVSALQELEAYKLV